MKLLVAIPTLDFMHCDFVRSLINLKIDCEYKVEIYSGTLVYLAREKLAKKAIEDGYDWMLWLDSDMVFQPTLLEDLQFSGKDFVTGVYHARRPGFMSCIFEKIDIEEFKPCEEYPNDTFRAEGCGFGCVLIKTDILKAVKEHYGCCFTPIEGYGEDIAFCRRARDLGFQLWCEPTAVCGHIGHITIYPEDHTRYMSRLEMNINAGSNNA